jgi:hypothetical protein
VDVGDAIRVIRQHKVLLEYVAQESHTSASADLGVVDQRVVRDDAEEQYVSYTFLRQSGNQHGNLKVDLQNDLTTGDNHYTNNRHQNLHLLDKYSKTAVAKVTQSEGTSFAQRSGKGGGRGGRSGNRKKTTTISIRNTGKTRLVTSVRRRGTLQTSALRSQKMRMTKNLWRAPLAVSRSSRMTSSL